jgi:hypothetical protein
MSDQENIDELQQQPVLVVHCGDPAKGQLQLQMASVWSAERRIDEIAYLTPQKAPELLVAFNRAYLDLTKMLARLELEVGTAQKFVDLRHAEVLLDVATEVLAKKGLSSSKDLRDAVVATDPQHQELVARLQALQAMQRFLQCKTKVFERSYGSANKFVGERSSLPGAPQPGAQHGASRGRDAQPGQNESGVPPAQVFRPPPDGARQADGAPPGRSSFAKANYSR